MVALSLESSPWPWYTEYLRHLVKELEPFVRGLARGIRPQYPELADLMVNETLLSIVAALIVLGFILILGWGAGRVVGQRLIGDARKLPVVMQQQGAVGVKLAMAEGLKPRGDN